MGGPALPARAPLQGESRAASAASEDGWSGFAGPGPQGESRAASAASEDGWAGFAGPGPTAQGESRAASAASEDGWAGFAGPGPTARRKPRSERSERRWVGRLCRTGTHCHPKAAQRAQRAKMGGPALPDRDPLSPNAVDEFLNLGQRVLGLVGTRQLGLQGLDLRNQ